MDKNAALARGSGWLARALLAHPESTQGFRPFKEPPNDCPPLATFHARLSQMLDTMPQPNAAGGLDLPAIDLSPEAKRTWVEFYNAIEVELRAGGEFADVRDVASKTADNAARIACLFHLFDSGPHGQISEPHMAGAAAIAAWHLYEARRFFGEIALPPELSAATKLDEWLQRFCRTNNVTAVPTRDAARLGPYRVRTEKAFKAALDVLRGLSRVRVVRDGRRKLVQVNPALLGGER
jgi:putative DNA primase/helicase